MAALISKSSASSWSCGTTNTVRRTVCLFTSKLVPITLFGDRSIQYVRERLVQASLYLTAQWVRTKPGTWSRVYRASHYATEPHVWTIERNCFPLHVLFSASTATSYIHLRQYTQQLHVSADHTYSILLFLSYSYLCCSLSKPTVNK